jgi:small-conductance mechanosensitive channel
VRVSIAQSLRQGLLGILLAISVITRVGRASAGDGALEGAPLQVANREIIRLRGPIAGYTANERVAAASKRIEAVLAAEHLPDVTSDGAPEGTRVLLGGKVAFLVTRVDIDEDIGETTAVVAREAAKRLSLAVAQKREQETPRYVAWAVAYALGATLLFAGILWLLVRVRGWATRRAARAASMGAKKLALGGVPLLGADWIPSLVRRLSHILATLVVLLGTVVWCAFVLLQFPHTRPWGEHIEAALLERGEKVGLAFVEALPGLVFVVLTVLIARGVLRLASLLFDRVEYGGLSIEWLSIETVRPTRRLFAVAVSVFALAIAYPYLPGAETEAFKGLSVLLGLMVSLGGSNLVGQAAAGLTLMYSRSLRSGDYVRIGDIEGTITEIGVFATRVRSGLGDEIRLPSSLVMGTPSRNYSRAVPGTGYVVDTSLTIGYATPWRQVHAMLLEAARRTPGISSEPMPLVRQTALSDFYVEYRLIAYTPAEHPPQRAQVLSDLHARIQDVFNEFGVQIMSPHYESDPAAPQFVLQQDWYAAPARRPSNDQPDALASERRELQRGGAAPRP